MLNKHAAQYAFAIVPYRLDLTAFVQQLVQIVIRYRIR
jgi:hypothetical protein